MPDHAPLSADELANVRAIARSLHAEYSDLERGLAEAGIELEGFASFRMLGLDIEISRLLEALRIDRDD